VKSRRDQQFELLGLMAEAELEKIRSDLPPDVARLLDCVVIVFEPHPTLEEVKEGVDPDQLGLFEGAEYGDTSLPDPPRIVLWLENLWDYAGRDPEIYREEIAITLLHEIGHYLGWDENQIEQRGLE